MDEEYDVVVLGTGLKEGVLAGLLSCAGKKVLHMDRNRYYGADCASLNLDALFEKFDSGKAPAEMGHNRDWNVDLIPKFIMGSGQLVKMLIKTDVRKYMDFKVVKGSFVVRGDSVHKVPASDSEAMSSKLMGMFEKRRARNFFKFVAAYEPEDETTHQGLHPATCSMNDVFEKFSLKPDTIDFVGHSLALYQNDEYLTEPAHPSLMRIKLYSDSMMRFGDSPYLYPLYGLGELPQGFARLSAVNGGTYMMGKSIDAIVTDDDGNVCGVQSEGEVVKCKQVVGDPSYFTEHVTEIGKVVRCICVLDHPIANTGNADSCQIVIPQRQCNRGHDIYVAVMSSAHNVVPKGKYLAICSTVVETEDPLRELTPALRLFGKIEKQFASVSPVFKPNHDGAKNNIFVTESYDSTSHFETTCHDIVDVWKRMTGEDLVLPEPTEETEEQ